MYISFTDNIPPDVYSNVFVSISVNGLLVIFPQDTLFVLIIESLTDNIPLVIFKFVVSILLNIFPDKLSHVKSLGIIPFPIIYLYFNTTTPFPPSPPKLSLYPPLPPPPVLL